MILEEVTTEKMKKKEEVKDAQKLHTLTFGEELGYTPELSTSLDYTIVSH